jgi:hypothetical protein
MLLYIAQTLMEGIVAPKAEFIEFATRENIDKKRVRFVLARFQKMETFLTDFYKSQLNRKVREKITLNLDIPTTKTALFDRCLPSRSMFLRLDTTRRSIACAPPNVLSSQIPDYRHIRLIVSKVFRNSGSFKLEEEDRVFYMENLKPLFNDQTVTNIENIKTIQFYTRPSPP